MLAYFGFGGDLPIQDFSQCPGLGVGLLLAEPSRLEGFGIGLGGRGLRSSGEDAPDNRHGKGEIEPDHPFQQVKV